MLSIYLTRSPPNICELSSLGERLMKRVNEKQLFTEGPEMEEV